MDRRALPHLLLPALAVLTATIWAGMAEGWVQTAIVGGLATIATLGSSVALLTRISRTERDRCRMGEELIQSQKLAAIGELSSGIAHEINNPLAIIGQECELMADLLGEARAGQASALAEVEDGLRQITLQVARCKDITHKLLSFARKAEPVWQETDVARLVEDMARLVDREAGLSEIVIDRQVEPGLPLVWTDPPLFRQVVLNVLTNAVQAVGRGGRVDVAVRARGDRIEVEVADSGPGIPEGNLPRIFDPFFTTKPPGQGTGLGLSLGFVIMQRLGGSIEARNAPGGGAVFTLRLRCERPASALRAPCERPATGRRAHGRET